MIRPVIHCRIVPIEKLRNPKDDSLAARVEVALPEPNGVYQFGSAEDDIEFVRR